MLLLNQIETYYPTNQREMKRNMLVEYLQHELLESMFKHPLSTKLSFMEGTAIRIVYDGQRFSEDLDFDNFGLSYGEFTKLLELTAKDMSLKGCEVEMRMVAKGAYHCYLRFPSLLVQNNLTTDPRAKILIRIDSVLKEKYNQPQAHIVNNFGVYQTILVNSEAVILSQKIAALLSRTKGRDVYDISWLLGRTEPDYQYLEKIAGIGSKEELKTRLEKRLLDLDLPKLATDVSPFLINSADVSRITTFPDFISQYFT